MTTQEKTIILDSSVWIAYLRTQDSHHQRALEILTKYKDTIFLIPEIVYFEILIRSYILDSNIRNIKHIINLFKTDKKIHFCKMNRSNTENLIIKYLTYIQLKSSDFQILMYVIKYKPDKFISFDKQLKREYSKITFNQNLL